MTREWFFSVSSCSRGGLGCAAQPQDAAANHQQDGNQLGPRHHSTEDLAPSRIVAQEFQEVPRKTVQEEISSEDLAIELLPLEQPHEDKEIRQLDGSFEELRWFQSLAQRSSYPLLRQRIGEGDAPEMIRRFSPTAARREAPHSPNCMPQGQSWRKRVTGGQRGQVIFPDVPRCSNHGRDQSARKHTSCLQGTQAEYLARMAGVVAKVD